MASWPGVPEPLPIDPIAEAGRQWEKHWGAGTVPPVAAVTSLMRAHQVVLARLNEQLEPHGLSYARYEALMLLFYSRAGELPLGKMGERLQLHPASVTNLVDGLEKLGLVARTAHPSDGRTTLARITDEGRTVAAAATAALNGIRFGMEPVGDEELVTLADVLHDLRFGAGDFSV